MPAKKKRAKKTPKKLVAKYRCPAGVGPIPAPCQQASLPHNVPQLAAELEAYLRCLCAWQTVVTRVVNNCCGAGPENVPPPPPPPF
jgi:hypothetical protein